MTNYCYKVSMYACILIEAPGKCDAMYNCHCILSCSGMVVGANVMLGFATVFDREQQRVGFAKSTCQCE